MSNGLVIIETRPEVGLMDTIENHIKHLGSAWGVTLFLSPDNIDEVDLDYLSHHCNVPCVYEINYRRLTQFEYNRILTSPLFWSLIPYERVFIAQTDGFMRRKGIEYFFQWDYIGSAWGWYNAEKGHGGNGGESLRTVKVMKLICERYIWTPQDGNEDVFFVNKMNESQIGRVANREDCIKFGSEQIYSENPLCCHAIEKYLTEEQIKKLRA